MGKIVSSWFMSLDGVVESPEQRQLAHFNEEMGAATGKAAENWNNTTILSGDVLTKLKGLQVQPEGSIGMSGSATLVRWLLTNSLLNLVYTPADQ
jgi:hypothetical protein